MTLLGSNGDGGESTPLCVRVRLVEGASVCYEAVRVVGQIPAPCQVFKPC